MQYLVKTEDFEITDSDQAIADSMAFGRYDETGGEVGTEETQPA